MTDAAEPDDQPADQPETDDTSIHPNTTPAGAGPDPLDAVARAATAWAKATRAHPKRIQRDRAIIAAFDSGATDREIAAASGMELDKIYRVHRQAGSIRADAEMDRRLAETSRPTAEMADKVGIWSDTTQVSEPR